MPARTMTADEFLRLPDEAYDDGVDRQLIDGVLREKPHAFADRDHGVTLARVVCELANWSDKQPGRWRGGSGGVGMRLPNAETVIGPDAALFDPETVAAQPPPPDRGLHVWHGAPRLAVEVVSPGDDPADREAVRATLLAAGTPVVWELDTATRTVTVHRPGRGPRSYGGDDVLNGDPDLPGFAVRADDLFGG